MKSNYIAFLRRWLSKTAMVLLLAVSLLLPVSSFSFSPAGSSAQAAGINPFVQGYIEGYLKNVVTPAEGSIGISGTVVEIASYDGRIFALELNPAATFTIDQVPVELNAFKNGMEVFGELQGMRLISLEAYSTANMGYIAPGAKVRKGLVKNIDRDQLQVVLATGEELSFFTSPATIVNKNGQNIPLSSLYEGDRVILFFDAVDSNVISRMEIEGDSIQVKDIYRGRLQIADQVEDSICLDEVQVLRNGDWQDYQASIALPYNSEVPLYVGRQQITRQYLKYYRGKEIYVLCCGKLGQDYIEKMIIKAQYESSFIDKITDINWYTECLELKNGKNIDFHDGSIIVKNGRLLDKYALNVGDDVLLVADGFCGKNSASVIYVLNEGINNSNVSQYHLYYGDIDKVLVGKLWIEDFSILYENEWEEFDDEEKELYYDDDSSIYDLASGEFLSIEEFLAGDFDDDKAYVYTDGDRVVAVFILEESEDLDLQRISSGVVSGLDNDENLGWNISIREIRDWSSRRNKWDFRSGDLQVFLAQAMIIKNDKIIDIEDIEPGNHIYLLREGLQAKILIVK